MAGSVSAQVVPTPEGKPKVTLSRTSDPINLDGVLDEPAWQNAEIIRNFRQQEPYEGTPATEKTEARVLFDGRRLYFGIRAYDSEPDRINARDLNRDSGFGNDDKIEILLDTYHDLRNAYRFAVNPRGTQQDALVTDEGRDVNVSWDTVWYSEAKMDGEGWTVEIAIPLSSLRFRDGADTWGINISRIIRRKNEEDLWSSWQRAFGLERVSQAGELGGVEELRRRRLVEIKPYVTARARQNVPPILGNRRENGVSAAAGIEVARIGITPSLTAEFTANPDFGQAEVDQQVVNLTRFSVFFPERRDFFLENAGIFLFGRPGVNQMFFTRRIGLTENGAPVPIDYGTKVTGKIGDFNVGFLHVQTREKTTDDTEEKIPRQQFTVARVKRDIFGRSNIGGIFTNRQGGTTNAYNRGAGVDAQLNLSNYWNVYGFFAKTFTPGLKGEDYTYRIQSEYNDNRLNLFGVYEDIGRHYNPELGFAVRTGIRQYFGAATYKIRPAAWKSVLREMRFTSYLEYYADRPTNTLQTRTLFTSVQADFSNSAYAFFQPYNGVTDRLSQPFRIRPGITIPAGTYQNRRSEIGGGSDSTKRFQVDGNYAWGTFYGGDRREAVANFTYRANEHLSLTAGDSFNLVELPQGRFSTNLFTGRVTYNFSRKVLSTVLLQLNSAARLSSINARVRYNYRPNSDIFFIYNQTTGNGLERPTRQFQVKVTYDFIR